MGYPKKLYKGTVKNRKMKTVLNDDDEQQLRSQGWVDFAQLGKGTVSDGSQSTAQSSAECAELKQNYEQLQSNYEQLQSFSTSFTQQWNDVDAVRNRLNELEQANRGSPYFG